MVKAAGAAAGAAAACAASESAAEAAAAYAAAEPEAAGACIAVQSLECVSGTGGSLDGEGGGCGVGRGERMRGAGAMRWGVREIFVIWSNCRPGALEIPSRDVLLGGHLLGSLRGSHASLGLDELQSF